MAMDKDTGETESFRRWLVVPDEAGCKTPMPKKFTLTQLKRIPRSKLAIT